MRYVVVIEKAAKNYAAFVPDLPGCVATGKTIAAVKKNISEAIEFHISGLQEDGLPVPKPSVRVASVVTKTNRPRKKAA